MNLFEKRLRSQIYQEDAGLLVIQTSRRPITLNLFWATAFLGAGLYFRAMPEYRFNGFYIFFFWCLALFAGVTLKNALKKITFATTGGWGIGQENLYRIHGGFRVKSERIPLDDILNAELVPATWRQYLFGVRTLRLHYRDKNGARLELPDVKNAKAILSHVENRIQRNYWGFLYRAAEIPTGV
jgi:hypothetical protein